MIVPDTLLLAQLKQGDEDAFENLFRRHYDHVYRVLLNLLGSHDEAEDLLQETFLALYCHPPTIEYQAELVAWLCRVALNRGYNALRGKQREFQRVQRASLPLPSRCRKTPMKRLCATRSASVYVTR